MQIIEGVGTTRTGRKAYQIKYFKREVYRVCEEEKDLAIKPCDYYKHR